MASGPIPTRRILAMLAAWIPLDVTVMSTMASVFKKFEHSWRSSHYGWCPETRGLLDESWKLIQAVMVWSGRRSCWPDLGYSLDQFTNCVCSSPLIKYGIAYSLVVLVRITLINVNVHSHVSYFTGISHQWHLCHLFWFRLRISLTFHMLSTMMMYFIGTYELHLLWLNLWHVSISLLDSLRGEWGKMDPGGKTAMCAHST